jgi:putative intracellular protease/amidase
VRILVICSRRFNRHELTNLLGTLRQAGHSFHVMSTDSIIQDELNLEFKKRAHFVLDQDWPEPDRYDGLAFSSGNMQDSELYWNHPTAKSYVEAFNYVGKPIYAICITVPAIRWAAEGKTVTCFPLIRSKDLLRMAGAKISGLSIARDQNLVTAEHQMASQMAAEEYCALLAGEPVRYPLVDANWKPRYIKRRDIRELEIIKAARRLRTGDG